MANDSRAKSSSMKRSMLSTSPVVDAAVRHQRGLAVDVPLPFVAALAGVAAHAGLCQPYPESHPSHFQLCAPGRNAASG